MSQKSIIVTGGSRGIGAAVAKVAAKQGFRICLSYLQNDAAANSVVEEIADAGGEAFAVQSDVSNESDVAKLWQTAIERFGQVSALVNNAGILDLQCRLEDASLARIKRIFETNVFGSILHAQQAIKHMSKRNGGVGGSIVNVSSIAARHGSPNEYVDYAASKGAIDTLTVGLSKELADEGIRVNAVRPGTTRTDIHIDGGEPDRADRIGKRIPLGRSGEPEEIAAAIMWLISDEASYATGSILDVAGGL